MPDAPTVPRPAPDRLPACRSCIPRRRRCRLTVLAALALGSSLILPPAGRADPPVTAMNSWFRYIMPQVPAGGYMTLKNTSSQPMVLTGASSAACGTLALHRTETSGGVDRMVPVPRVTVPADGTFRFAEGGYHMMCMNPAMHVGQTVTVTLSFADGSRVPVPFVVYGVSGPPGSAPNGAETGMKMKMPM